MGKGKRSWGCTFSYSQFLSRRMGCGRTGLGEMPFPFWTDGGISHSLSLFIFQNLVNIDVSPWAIFIINYRFYKKLSKGLGKASKGV